MLVSFLEPINVGLHLNPGSHRKISIKSPPGGEIMTRLMPNEMWMKQLLGSLLLKSTYLSLHGIPKQISVWPNH